MSIRQLNLVWEHSSQRGGALLILLAIADFADDAGVAYPGVETLANKARMSERNARYVLRDLEASGELSIDPNAGPKGANLYRINLSQNLEPFERKAAKVAPGAKIAPAENGDKEGGKTRPKGGQRVAPEPSGTIKEPSERYTPSADVLAWVEKNGWTPWLETHLEHFRDYIAQPKNRKRYTDLDAAFRSCVRADWGDVRFKSTMAAKRGEKSGVSATSSDWWTTTNGITAKGRELGVERKDDPEWVPGENWLWYRAQVCAAAGDGPWCNDRDEYFQRFLAAARERRGEKAAHA